MKSDETIKFDNVMIKHGMMHGYVRASFFTCLFAAQGFAQCPSGDLIINSQEDVNEFYAEYPNCTQINGFFIIDQTDPEQPITDLTPLSGLQSVTGEVHISRMFTSEGPTPLNGLENLTSVGSILIGTWPEYGAELIPMASLEPLSGISGTVEFLYLRNIESTTPGTNFENITAIDRLEFRNCPNLNTLPTFPALVLIRSLSYFKLNMTEIAIPPSITNFDVIYPWQDPIFDVPAITFYDNPNLISIASEGTFSSCGSIGITNNPELLFISGFESLQTITHYLSIFGNYPSIFDSFHNVSVASSTIFQYTPPSDTTSSVDIILGIGQNQPELQFLFAEGGGGVQIQTNSANTIQLPANLTIVEGGLYINAPGATSITGFENLETVGNFLILYVPSMNQFPDFTSLTSIGYNFNVNYNMTVPGISDFSGFNNLQHIGGEFKIGNGGANNSTLVSLNGLQNLQSVGVDFTISGAPMLADISAISALQSVGNVFEIRSLPSLASTNFVFENLSSVGFLRFRALPVTILPAFPEIESLYQLSVRENLTLFNLDILPALQSVDNLAIIDNPALAEIFCNQNIQIGSMNISNNPNLHNCANYCLCSAIENANNVTLSNNGENCTSSDEILSLCSVILDNEDLNPLDNVSIHIDYSNVLHISAEHTNLAGTLHIYDLTGRIIYTHQNTQPEYFSIPFPYTSSGIYFISITTSEGQKTQKIFYAP